MVKEKIRYKIVHPYLEKIDSQNDFLDIEVEIGTEKYRGSITTTKFVEEKLETYKQTGENKDGSYFCAKGMIILKDLKHRTIRRTIEDLIDRNDLKDFLES
jgi:hypothetical protein